MAGDPNQDVVDDIFASEIALDAAYTSADGLTTNPSCRVILHRRGLITRGFEPVTFGGSSLRVGAAPKDILVRVSDVPVRPEEGATFAVVDDAGNPLATYTVGESPLPDDPDELVWRCVTSTEGV